MRALPLRLTAIVLLFFLLAPAVVLTLLVAVQARTDRIEAEKDNALRIARSLVASQEQMARTTHGLLTVLARDPTIQHGDWERCWRFLGDVMSDEAFTAYTGLGVFDLQGDLVCNSMPVERPVNVQDRPWFIETLRTRGFASGGYQIGRASGRPILAFGHPVFDGNHAVTAVLLAALSLEWLDQVVARTRLPAHATVTVVDRDGIILARAPRGAAVTGKLLDLNSLEPLRNNETQGFVEGIDPDGHPRLFAFARMADTNATVLIGIDRNALLASADAAQRAALSWLGVIATAGLAAIWFSFAKLLRPVDALLRATRRLARGLWERVDEGTAVKEFHELAVAFDTMAQDIQRREMALRDSREDLQRLLNTVGDGIAGVDLDGRVTFANPACQRLTGFTTEELVGADMHQRMHHTRPDGHAHPREQCPITLCMRQGREARVLDDLFWRKDGTSFRAEYTVTPAFRDNAVVGAVIVFRDVTERHLAEQRRRQSEARFRLLFETAHDAMCLHRLDGRFIDVNPAACERLGYRKEELMRLNVDAIEDPAQARPDRLAELREAQVITFETIHRGRDGRSIPAEVVAHLVNYDGAPAVFSIARDISERRRAEANLERLAHFDCLTGLPNRALIGDRLHQAITLARRHGRSLCLCYLDLDRFKPVNDMLGHDAGDEVLKHVAERLSACVRASDTVGRLGGDEFVILLPDLEHPDRGAAIIVAEKAIASLNQPMALSKGVVGIGASIGIAFYPQDARDPDELLARADAALYAAKAAGRNTWRFVTEALADA